MSGLKRFDGWPARLEAFFKDVSGQPFAWGRLDCALFAASGVAAITGQDFAAAFRGRYKTAAGSVRALKRVGAGDLEGTVTAFLGANLKSPKKAQRGDVVSFETETGRALGIVDLTGSSFAAMQEEGGFVTLPLRFAVKAWRV